MFDLHHIPRPVEKGMLQTQTCADPGIFVRGGGGGGGPGQSDKKSCDVFLCFFCPQLILQKSNCQFQRNLSFFKVPEGCPSFCRGVQLFQGAVQLLFPYRNPYNL